MKLFLFFIFLSNILFAGISENFEDYYCQKMPEKAIFYLNGIIEKKNRPREHICAALNMRSSMFKKIKNIGKSREDLIEASEICLK